MKPELLSPVSSFETLHAAIKGGCDAVYLGLKEFNMRESARNFTLSELKKVSLICKDNNVKIYLTLNTIIYDNEIERIGGILKKIKGLADAVICWDFSVINLCRGLKIPIHISTQASVANSKTAEFYKSLGAERIILARELNLKQIKKISNIIPIECFCHGAMCVAVSGRCFTSQFLHCESANRGECIHPCRRGYIVKDEEGNELKLENSRVLSAKDLCTLPFIEKMKKAGIKAFKIEGRNRNPEYVYTVTKIYRKALDRKLSKKELKESLKELSKVYNRGFSSGFYIKMPTSDDFSYTEHGEQKEKKQFVGRIEKYWKNPGVAHIRMFAGKLKIGNEVYIQGKKTFFRAKIESMEINHKKIHEAEKGQDVGIKLSECKKGDEVFLIKKKINNQA